MAFTVPLDALISHRFRGFSAHENSVEGLVAALEFGVKVVEFDIRMARCGTPVIFHDEFAKDESGQVRLICDVMAKYMPELGGDFSHIPTAESLFITAKSHATRETLLLIDVKDFGFEDMIRALIRQYGLQEQVVIVSWLPQVLFRMREICPEQALCFSHWCQKPDKHIASRHEIMTSTDGIVEPEMDAPILGRRMGWHVEPYLTGDILDLVAGTGAICVPQDMITQALSDYYHDHGVQVTTFSYVDWPTIRDHKTRFKVDRFFIDNRAVFDQLT